MRASLGLLALERTYFVSRARKRVGLPKPSDAAWRLPTSPLASAILSTASYQMEAASDDIDRIVDGRGLRDRNIAQPRPAGDMRIGLRLEVGDCCGAINEYVNGK